MKRIYFDHAATSFPKPDVVLQAMRDFAAIEEAAVGRGAYRSSRNAGQLVTTLRREIARWIDAESESTISIHAGGTEALNAAILGTLRPGDHVVVSEAEHNSVLRPLYHLVREQVILWTTVPVGPDGVVDADRILQAVTPETAMVAVVHAANVNGAVQPIDEIGSRLRQMHDEQSKPIFLTDAAQTFGYLPLSVRDSCVDLLAAPGHKGGCGPLGTGFLYVAENCRDRIRPTLFGGTGTQSESLEMPTDYPSALEAGNMNVTALAGWLAGLQDQRGDLPAVKALEDSRLELQRLAQTIDHELRAIDGLHLLGQQGTPQLPVFSLKFDSIGPTEAAMILDSEFGIEVRSGLHCAAMIHKAIGSPDEGTLRVSAGRSTSSDDLQQLFAALSELAAE